MKIEIEINEEKILELAQSSSMEDLPRIILSQARQEAINVCVNEIKNKIENQLEEYFNIAKNVIPIDDDGSKALMNVINTIEPERLFENHKQWSVVAHPTVDQQQYRHNLYLPWQSWQHHCTLK